MEAESTDAVDSEQPEQGQLNLEETNKPPPEPELPEIVRLKVGNEIKELPRTTVEANFGKGMNNAQMLTKINAERQRLMKETEAFAKERELVGQLTAGLKSGDISLFRHLGIDPVEFAVKVLEPEVKKAQMSDDERRRMEQEASIKEREERIKAMELNAQQQQLAQAAMQQEDILKERIASALERTGLPKRMGPQAIALMADKLLRANALGIDWDEDEIAMSVKDELTGTHNALLGGMEPDALYDFLGNDMAEKIVKEHLRRYQERSKVPSAPKTQAPRQPRQSSEREKRRSSELWDELNQMIP